MLGLLKGKKKTADKDDLMVNVDDLEMLGSLNETSATGYDVATIKFLKLCISINKNLLSIKKLLIAVMVFLIIAILLL